jgi:hypothetical protein
MIAAAATAHRSVGAQVVDPGVSALVLRIEQIIRAGDPAAYMDLLAPLANWERAEAFAKAEIRPGATRVTLRERNRYSLPGSPTGGAFRLLVDGFVEHGGRARAATWLIDVERTSSGEWRVADQVPVSVVDGLHHVAIDTGRQFRARDFTVRADDVELTLTDGVVFLIRSGEDDTGLVLTGRGEMRFAPTPEAERGQVQLFAGATTLTSSFDAAYIRAARLDRHADISTLTAVPVDQRDVRRAEAVFREESAKAYAVNLGDLSPERWSAAPGAGEFIAEVRTRRFGTLTYARSPSEAEDISLFHRRNQQYVSLYTSQAKIEERGRFWDEDEVVPYDVLDYDLDVSYTPIGTLIDARARMRLRVKRAGTTQVNLRLADSLTVRSVTSDEFGRLFTLRAQNLLVVNLPEAVDSDAELTLTIAYGGSLQTQGMLREALDQQPTFDEILQQSSQQLSQRPFDPRILQIRYLYSAQTYWYPQSLVTDYATARLRITLPAGMGCVASGERDPDSPALVADLPDHVQHLFAVERPVRYLAFMATRLEQTDRLTVALDAAETSGSPPGSIPQPVGVSTAAFPGYRSLDLTVDANPRMVDSSRRFGDRAADIASFYYGLTGDLPYKSLGVALVESTNLSGHSPAYLALLGEPVPGQSASRPAPNPVNIAAYPDFVLAHEIAHQWWGQAVGWRNYHEQWLSEGFAQYFALLYLGHDRGEEAFGDAMRQMRRSAMERSSFGPVYLGYRLGQVRNDRAIFRELVYNKGAAILHMLRRFVGDDAFLTGLRHYYTSSRFTKAATEDLRRAMETASGRDLARFFDRWIYGSALPDLRFTYRVESAAEGALLVLQFEQRGDLIFDVPVTVAVQYADRRVTHVPVNVSERVAETRVPLDGALRGVSVRDDDGTLAEARRP